MSRSNVPYCSKSFIRVQYNKEITSLGPAPATVSVSVSVSVKSYDNPFVQQALLETY